MSDEPKLPRLEDILARVDTGDTVMNPGRFVVSRMLDQGALIRYERWLPDEHVNGNSSWQGGRKWYISPYATEQEIFRTCLLAIQTFEYHELLERFKVDGKRFQTPHPEGMRRVGKVTWETLF